MRRLLLVTVGVLLGFGAGSCVLALGLAAALAASPAWTGQAMVDVFALILGSFQLGTTGAVVGNATLAVWRMLVTVCFVPVCLVGVLGEAAGWRGPGWCAGGTALLTAALPFVLQAAQGEPAGTVAATPLTTLLAVTGAASGAAFWLVAGRSRARVR